MSRKNSDDELFGFADYEDELQVITPKVPEIELGDEFKKILDLLEKTNDSYFITGRPGTGKSTLLREFNRTTKKQIVVLAPTGIAAVNVEGQTIHSFFRFPPEILFPDTVRQIGGRDIFKKLDAIIIDEISMVRSDMMDAMDILLRAYGPFSFKPFGGIQMLFFGDLYQLPPVIRRDDSEAFYSMYTGTWFFNSKAVPDMELKTLELTKIYRQTEPEFIDLLEKIRNNTLQQVDLDKINTRHDPFTDRPDGEIYLTLTTVNETAKQINNKKLNALPDPPRIYIATVEGIFKEESFPTDRDLTLKKNTQVIFLKNDGEGRWANGTLGKIISLHSDHVMVEVKTKLGTSNSYRVEPSTWVNIKYEANKATKKVKSTEIGKFKQYPLKLAYAISIHRSQGQTFDNADIHFGSGTFVSGHAYTALSRVRTLGGIKLLTKLSHRDVTLDNQVVEFLEKSKYIEENPSPIKPLEQF